MIVTPALCGACGAPRLQAAPPQAPATDAKNDLDQAFEQMVKYKFGDSRLPLSAVADAVRRASTDAKAKKAMEQRLAALLGPEAKATPDCKRFVCRQLRMIGTGASVPALERLLDDEQLSHMARYALEQMADPAAAAALRSGLDRLKGKLLVGAINSVGIRRDGQAGGRLVRLLGEKDGAVSAAAAAALGRIGGPEAAKALQAARPKASKKLRPVVTDALLLCADRLVQQGKKKEAAGMYRKMYVPAEPEEVRTAALRGLVAAGDPKAAELLIGLLKGKDARMRATAIRCVREIPGEPATKAFAAELPALPPAGQVLLLDALAERGDAGAMGAVLAATRSQDETVRIAAVKALGPVGDASVVELLVKLGAGGGKEADAARRSLDLLRGKDVDKVMLEKLPTADAKVRAELIRSLGARRAAGAAAVLLKAAGDADPGVRAAAVNALALVAGKKELPALVGLLVKSADADRPSAEKAVLTTCSRIADKDGCAAVLLSAAGKAKGPARAGLYGLVGRIGGPRAVKALLAAVKDADPAVQDAAVRALSTWRDPTPAADLLKLAKTTTKKEHKILALRGYVNMARMGRPPEQKVLKMYKQALALAGRPEEKKLLLAALAGLKSPEAMNAVAPLLGEKAVAREAVAAARRILRYAGRGEPKKWAEALRNVVQTTRDKKLLKQAGDALRKIEKSLKGGKARAPVGWAAPALAALALQATPSGGEAKPAPRTRPARDGAKAAAGEKLGWRLGVQAYTFRRFTFYEAVEKTAALGLKYIEMYPGQRISKDNKGRTNHGMSEKAIAEVKKKLDGAGVKAVCYGVVGLGRDEKAHRKVFEFAKKMGIEVIVTETYPTELLDKLSAEYDVRLALHNHPHSWPPEKVLTACKGRSSRIGACADTGHWMRAGLKPVETLKKLQGRIISLHFKDLNQMGRAHDVPWGTGAGDLKGMLAELHRQGFQGVFSMEYEHITPELMSNLAKCVAYFDAVAAELAAKPGPSKPGRK